MTSIGQAVTAATEYLTAHPAEAAYTDTLATAIVEDGLRIRVTGPHGEKTITDMSTSVGGGATAPSPGWLLRAAEASCVATLVAMRAAVLGHTLAQLEVTVDSESDDRGILGIDPAVPAGPLSARVHVRMAAEGVDRAELESIARWGIDHCPVCDALRRVVPVSLEVDIR